MILSRHEFELKATCPVDGSEDTYAVTVETTETIPVEMVLRIARNATANPAYQEAITLELSDKLGARVTTVGQHSGVLTTCKAEPW